MEEQNAIEVNDVRKSFKVFNDRGYMLKEMVLFANRRKYEIHEVLNGISFRVKKGKAIGLIGQNGCGKSTTLKLLTKIILLAIKPKSLLSRNRNNHYTDYPLIHL